jgi:hypothetical protein
VNKITVEALANELGVHVNEVSRQVSRLCGDPSWGPQRVVTVAVESNRLCHLHVEAADEIRELLTAAVAA